MRQEEIERLLDAVCEESGLELRELRSHCRRQDIVDARDLAIKILYERGCPSRILAAMFGLTHSSLSQSRKRTAERIINDPSLRDHYLRLKGEDMTTMAEYSLAVLAQTDKACSDLSYLALAMCGEAGELADKVKKSIRDKSSTLTDKDREALALEAGDTLWYLTVLCDRLGYSLSEVAKMNQRKVRDRLRRGVLHGSGDNR